MSGSYDLPLVLLSLLIAAFASFITLGYTQHLRNDDSPSRLLWMGMVGLTLSSGIWPMHFIGMFTFGMGMLVAYDFYLTTLSCILAISALLLHGVIYSSTEPAFLPNSGKAA